jgi:hypothetical protein
MINKRYCFKCGKECNKVFVDAKRYDPDTGKKIYYIKYRCPDYGKWFTWLEEHEDCFQGVVSESEIWKNNKS